MSLSQGVSNLQLRLLLSAEEALQSEPIQLMWRWRPKQKRLFQLAIPQCLNAEKRKVAAEEIYKRALLGQNAN